MPPAVPASQQVPPISGPVLAFFRRIVHRYFRRQFHAVRVAGAEHVRSLGPEPVIVIGSHGSWWDPMAMFLLAEQLLPRRRHYAPMDARALERYGILRRIGVFGVELASARGGAQFLRTSLAILAGGGALWMTPQGRFADPRERPLSFKPGLAALLARVPHPCTVVPLALEYPFWDERLPECLLLFGPAMRVEPGEAADSLEQTMRHALEAAMDELASRAIARSPAAFETLAQGRAGTGGFYQLAQQLWARLRGKPYQAEHTRHPLEPNAPTPQPSDTAATSGASRRP